jgi:hypothetical protein
MLVFRSLDDVRKARLPTHLKRLITEQMETLIAGYGDAYNPVDDGYIVLIDGGTTDEEILALTGRSILDMTFENVERDGQSDILVGTWIANNSFCLSFILDISDPGIDPIIRNRFLAELEETGRSA